jgi:hypothetical protein
VTRLLLVLFLFFPFFPLVCQAQIADVAYDNTVTTGARGGKYISGDLNIRGDAWGLEGRSIGRRWDAGGTYRLYRAEDQFGGIGRYADVGATVMYGSDGPKGAAVGGLIAGDSEELYFWARGAIGNFRAISAGFRIGRLDLSGLWANYFESKIEAKVFLSTTQRLAVSVGYSTTMGLSGGLQKTWGWKH